MSLASVKEGNLCEAISRGIVKLYGANFDPAITKATTYFNDNVVVCIVEDLPIADELADAAAQCRAAEEALAGRAAFQREHEREFIAAVEARTFRDVVGFMSANQTSTGVAAELFFLSRT